MLVSGTARAKVSGIPASTCVIYGYNRARVQQVGMLLGQVIAAYHHMMATSCVQGYSVDFLLKFFAGCSCTGCERMRCKVSGETVMGQCGCGNGGAVYCNLAAMAT